MKIIIKTKNLELTDSLQLYINKRIEGLKKLLAESADIFVEVKKETLHHKKGNVFKTEATLHLPGKSLVAMATGEDLGKTVTHVRDELKREIKKHKTKAIHTPRRTAKKQGKDTL